MSKRKRDILIDALTGAGFMVAMYLLLFLLFQALGLNC